MAILHLGHFKNELYCKFIQSSDVPQKYFAKEKKKKCFKLSFMMVSFSLVSLIPADLRLFCHFYFFANYKINKSRIRGDRVKKSMQSQQIAKNTQFCVI